LDGESLLNRRLLSFRQPTSPVEADVSNVRSYFDQASHPTPHHTSSLGYRCGRV